MYEILFLYRSFTHRFCLTCVLRAYAYVRIICFTNFHFVPDDISCLFACTENFGVRRRKYDMIIVADDDIVQLHMPAADSASSSASVQCVRLFFLRSDIFHISGPRYFCISILCFQMIQPTLGLASEYIALLFFSQGHVTESKVSNALNYIAITVSLWTAATSVLRNLPVSYEV